MGVRTKTKKPLLAALGREWVKTFAANRVQQIKYNTTSGQWCYIPAKENPADSASRGLIAAQVNSIDH